MVDKARDRAATASVDGRTGIITVTNGSSVVAANKAVKAVQQAQKGAAGGEGDGD
jgi:hypothetical protein